MNATIMEYIKKIKDFYSLLEDSEKVVKMVRENPRECLLLAGIRLKSMISIKILEFDEVGYTASEHELAIRLPAPEGEITEDGYSSVAGGTVIESFIKKIQFEDSDLGMRQ